MWSRSDRVPWDRLHSDGPLPLGIRGPSWKRAGMRIVLYTASNICHREGRAIKMTMLVSVAG